MDKQELKLLVNEWLSLAFGTADYQKQKLLGNLLNLRGTAKRKITEQVNRFIDHKNANDPHFKKIADRLVGAIAVRDTRAVLLALRDLLKVKF